MADEPETPNPAAPSTEGVAPAPGAAEGQAGGSPSPADTTPTSGDDGGGEDVKALRRRLTEQGEELKGAKRAAKILEAAMSKPGWKVVEAEILGRTIEPEEDLDAEMFGNEDPERLAKGKRWKARMKEEIREELRLEMQPVAREVAATREDKDIERFLKADGLARDERFDTFREDFAAENPSYGTLRKVDPSAASKWLVSSFSIAQKRSGRQPVGDRADATLERGGGAPARVGAAASQVKIDHSDPNKILKLHDAIVKGETPVDENGHPYPVKRR